MTPDEIELQKLRGRADILFSQYNSLHKAYCRWWDENITWEKVIAAKLAYNEAEDNVQIKRMEMGLDYLLSEEKREKNEKKTDVS